MRRHVPLLLCLVAALVAACGGTPILDTRTFQLKYIRADQAQDIIAPYVYADRPNAKGMISRSASTLTVRETRDNLEKIARVLAQYDVPRPMVRLTFHLIQADGAATTDPAIADVETTLRALFRFQGYRLVQQGLFITAEGGDVQQMLGSYAIFPSVERVSGSGDSALVDLGVRLRGPHSDFSTRVTVPAGKTAVLGNVGDDPRGTLILTVKPELVSASP
jgi:hypothetical protein